MKAQGESPPPIAALSREVGDTADRRRIAPSIAAMIREVGDTADR